MEKDINSPKKVKQLCGPCQAGEYETCPFVWHINDIRTKRFFRFVPQGQADAQEADLIKQARARRCTRLGGEQES